MARILFLLCSLFAFAGCGGSGSSGGGSGDDGGGSEPPPRPVEQFSLGGTAIGLNGTVTIANGDEQLSLSENGAFTFANKLDESSRYDVDIVTLPERQLCEVLNSSSIILRDRDDVIVECASMVEVEVAIARPSAYELRELRLLSNYAAKGGPGEPALQGDADSLLTFENTYVSLLGADSELIYLAFVDAVDGGSFALSSATTALALVLLEPTVAAAIQDRGLSASDIAADLAAALNADNSLDALSQQIALLAENRSGLAAGSAQLAAPLQAALQKAVDYLATVPYAAGAAPVSRPAGNAAAKVVAVVSPTSVAEQAGVAFAFQRQTPPALSISASNQRNRYISLSSDTFEDTLLAPGASREFALAQGLASQEVIDISVTGPGLLGEVAAENRAALFEAAAASALYQHLFPSITSLLGLANPGVFNIGDCLSDDTEQALLDSLVGLIDGDGEVRTALLEKRYFDAYLALNASARGSFLNAPMDELFDCDKFGAGVILESEQALAMENISHILQTLNALLDGDSGLTGLFAHENITLLVSSMENSVVDIDWSLGNLLQLNIAVDADAGLEGEPFNLSGSCVNPIDDAAIDCEISWDFGDGNSAEGAQVQHSYAVAGRYTVVATAVDADGATHSQALDITVTAPAPNIRVTTAQGTEIAEGSLAHAFGTANIFDSAVAVVRIENHGSGDLNISDISTDDSVFVLNTGSQILAPGAGVDVDITFAPAQLGERSALVTVASDDPDQSAFTFTVEGEGVSGEWVVVQNGETTRLPIRRTFARANVAARELPIRLFTNADTGNDYPQLNLTLSGYDLQAEGRGNGEYSLDDVGPATCRGQLIEALAEIPWCTRTGGLFADTPYTGTVTVESVAGDNEFKVITFSFSAVRQNCLPAAGPCESITVSGSARFPDPI